MSPYNPGHLAELCSKQTTSSSLDWSMEHEPARPPKTTTDIRYSSPALGQLFPEAEGKGSERASALSFGLQVRIGTTSKQHEIFGFFSCDIKPLTEGKIPDIAACETHIQSTHYQRSRLATPAREQLPLILFIYSNWQ